MDIDRFPSIAPSSPLDSPTEPIPSTLYNTRTVIDEDDDDDSDWCRGYTFFETDAVNVIVPALAAISIFCSLITILAITIPLFDKEERKKMSVYNLYLVYLAIPDLIMSISFILMVIKCHYDDSLWVTFSSAFLSNVLVNVVILHELLKLLVDSKTRRRSTPPSLLKASTQVLAMYAVSITSGLLELCLDQYVTFFTLLGCAFVYFLWVLLRICYGRLLCYNSDTLRRLKVLVIYFSRIICLNMVTGILCILFNLLFHLPDDYFYMWTMIQVWIGFGLSLTKPDVLGYVRRLFGCFVRPCSKIGSALRKNMDLTPTELEASAGPDEIETTSRDPEHGDPGSPADYNKCDDEDDNANEDGNTRIKEDVNNE